LHIALVNSFPNRLRTAEREFIARFRIAAQRLEHCVYEAVTSDDLHLCEPDFVIATHEFSPKLTPHLTLGAMWSPPSFYETDEDRLASILSYDGYLVGSRSVAKFIDDLEYSTGIKKPKSDFLFLPTSPKTAFSIPRDRPWDLVYIGIHWDGSRHAELLAGLEMRGLLNAYGPPKSWASFSRSYRGEVPFDGSSVAETLRRHGVALCLHKAEHRAHDTPSMRLFEAAAAGCVIIADDIPFARRTLGDSAFYLQLEGEHGAEEVADHLAWIKANPRKAAAMAAESHRLISAQYSLENLVERCCAFASNVAANGRDERRSAVAALQADLDARASAPARPRAGALRQQPLVDVIVRVGGRAPEYARRAIESVARQDFGTYRILLVDYKGRGDLRELARTESGPKMSVDYTQSPDTGFRSTSTWTGLKNVTAPFFAQCDDDDSVMPDHFSDLLKVAAEHPECGLVYSGVVRVEEEDEVTIEKPHFSGPLGRKILEKRELKFLNAYDLDRLLHFDNYIQSNAWVARRELLDAELLADPEMQVSEDVYLYLLLAARTKFMCNFRPTAYWNWRSRSQDNSMLAVDQERWAAAGAVIMRRLRHLKFPASGRIAGVAWRRPLNPATPPPARFILRPGVSETFGTPMLDGSEHENFNRSEPGGTWTSAHRSLIVLKLSEPLRRGSLTLAVIAAKPIHQDQQTVTLRVNGQLLCERTLTGWIETEMESEFELPSEVTELRLTVGCEHLICPRLEGWGKDPRELGVFCKTLKLSVPATRAGFRDLQLLEVP
jgi:hypothetical protein